MMRCFQGILCSLRLDFCETVSRLHRSIIYRNLAIYFVLFTRKSQCIWCFQSYGAVLSQIIGFYVIVGRHVLLIHSYGYADCCGAVTCGERLITLHIKSHCAAERTFIHNRVCIVSDRLRMFMLRTYIFKWLMIVERGKGSPAFSICTSMNEKWEQGQLLTLLASDENWRHIYTITSLSHKCVHKVPIQRAGNILYFFLMFQTKICT